MEHTIKFALRTQHRRANPRQNSSGDSGGFLLMAALAFGAVDTAVMAVVVLMATLPGGVH